MPLSGFHRLPAPISRSELNGSLYAPVLAALHQTQEEIGRNRPAYAPFQHYGSRELRAQQGYLTKFPAALVAVLFLETRTAGANIVPEPPRGRGQAYVSDAERRSAIERHAVEVAKAHYRATGATEIVELGKPYDLRVIVDGHERHVEVKGSTVPNVETVQLTQGEVVHARHWGATDLVVVDGIECGPGATGPLTTSGGIVRIFNDWSPTERSLKPTHLRYRLP
jgi:hypothetical protein